MSESAASGGDPGEEEAFSRLEKAVGKLIDERSALLDRVRELEGLLARMRTEGGAPARLQESLANLEAENLDLRRRIAEGREGVDRLLNRLRFLETQR